MILMLRYFRRHTPRCFFFAMMAAILALRLRAAAAVDDMLPRMPYAWLTPRCC